MIRQIVRFWIRLEITTLKPKKALGSLVIDLTVKKDSSQVYLLKISEFWIVGVVERGCEQSHEVEFFSPSDDLKLGCGPQEFNSSKFRLHLTK